MLVLSRKQGERIIINDTISIVVVRISEGKVWIGVDAPKTVEVHREEVWDKIQREQQQQQQQQWKRRSE